MNKGILYVVATPIGNLEDMTYRAVNTLKDVSFILAEDTRESKKLLERYNINTQLVSYRDQNHERIIEKVVEKLNMGLDLALISDCGTPLISDPGYKLVNQLRKNGYEIISIPGPSAVIAALSVSGLPTDRFLFLGFLPKSDIKREKLLEMYKDNHGTICIYESPKRILKLLNQISLTLGDVEIYLAKDISKLREQSFFGTVNSVIGMLNDMGFEDTPHGEFVCLINTSSD